MYLLFSTDNFALFNSSSKYAKGKIRGIFSPPVLTTLPPQINLFSWTMSAMWLFPSNTTSGFLVKAEATYPTFNASYRFCPTCISCLRAWCVATQSLSSSWAWLAFQAHVIHCGAVLFPNFLQLEWVLILFPTIWTLPMISGSRKVTSSLWSSSLSAHFTVPILTTDLYCVYYLC